MVFLSNDILSETTLVPIGVDITHFADTYDLFTLWNPFRSMELIDNVDESGQLSFVSRHFCFVI
jgi:hypothetical protein